MVTALHSDRRRLLASLVACATAGAAGCLSAVDETDDHVHTAEDQVGTPPDDAFTDVAVRSRRAFLEEPLVELADEDRDQLHEIAAETFVTSSQEAAALEYHPEVDDVESLRSFVEETDFERETLVVDQRRMDASRGRELAFVEADDDAFAVSFCWTERDAESGTAVMDARLIRVPYPYQERPSSVRSAVGSGCEPRDA